MGTDKFNITLLTKTGVETHKFLGCRDFYQGEGFISFFREGGEYMKTNLNFLIERTPEQRGA